jgi:hypothetical protein
MPARDVCVTSVFWAVVFEPSSRSEGIVVRADAMIADLLAAVRYACH